MSAALFALALAASPTPSFHDFQVRYFSHLDLRAEASTLAELPALEADVARLATVAIAGGTIPGWTADQVSRLPLYDALLTLDDAEAIHRGLVPLAAFEAKRPLGDVAARVHHAAETLAGDAQRLRPDDGRISGWYQSALLFEQSLAGKPNDPVLLRGLLDRIDDQPTFNLWTAMLLFRTVPSTDPLFLELAATAYAQQHQAGACTQRPEDCYNIAGVTPTNYQASSAVLGDTLLRGAEAKLAAGDHQTAMQWAGWAQGTYAQVDSHEALGPWPERASIAPRIERAKQILQGHQPTGDDFWSHDDASRFYECGSCHGRAAAH